MKDAATIAGSVGKAKAARRGARETPEQRRARVLEGATAKTILSFCRDVLETGETTALLPYPAPDFDEAYAAASAVVATMSDDEEALRLLDSNIRSHAMRRTFEVIGDGLRMPYEAALFAIPISGMANCVADVVTDPKTGATLVDGLMRRGVAHPDSTLAIANVAVAPMGAAVIGPGAIWRLTEAMFCTTIHDIADAALGEAVANGAMEAVRRTFGAEARAPDAGEIEVGAPTCRMLVGVRLLALSGEGPHEDYFTHWADGTELDAAEDPDGEAGGCTRYGAHEMWWESMQRDFAERGVGIGLPTTFTELAAQAAGATLQDFLDVVAEETGWPMSGQCDEIHLHRGADLTTIVLRRRDATYGPLMIPSAAIAYEPSFLEEAIDEALADGGQRLMHVDASTMPEGCGVDAAPGAFADATRRIQAPANDNRADAGPRDADAAKPGAPELRIVD